MNAKTTAVKSWSHWAVSSLVSNWGTPAQAATESPKIVLSDLNTALDHHSCCSLVISDTHVNAKTTTVKSWSHWAVGSLVSNWGSPAQAANESTQIVLWEQNTALDHDSCCSLVISDTQVNAKTTATKSESHWGVSSQISNCDTPGWTSTEFTQIVLCELSNVLDHDSLCSLVISDTRANARPTGVKSRSRWAANQ